MDEDLFQPVDGEPGVNFTRYSAILLALSLAATAIMIVILG